MTARGSRHDEGFNAAELARMLGGEAWQSGGDIWLVVIRRPDGRVVAIGEESVCEYLSEQALDEGHPTAAIALT